MNNAITIRELSFKYPDGSPALEGINLDIQQGESVGIIGSNGAGKSTLLLHLNATLRSKVGTVAIDGTTIDGHNLRTIRQKVGMVFQNPDDQLFMPTVFDDIAFGLLNQGVKGNEVKDKITAILSRFGLSGYETKSPQHLSLGEKKKIALAGILVLKPTILVLDEPTANLDPRIRREFIKLLDGISATKVIAGHDLEMITRTTKRVILLNKGKKVAEGPTTQILADADLLVQNGL